MHILVREILYANALHLSRGCGSSRKLPYGPLVRRDDRVGGAGPDLKMPYLHFD